MRESEAIVCCPYCGESVQVLLDTGGEEWQSYVEDCEICCRPWLLTVEWNDSGEAVVVARTDEE
jgi:hypothetical protein